MKKIILTGHGEISTGIKGSIELLAGQNEDVMAVDFTSDMSDSDLAAKLQDVISSFPDTSFLFVCDILGGTPYKECAKIANNNHHMEVVAGCNLGAILEASLMKETMELSDLANFIVNQTRSFAAKFEKVNTQAAKVDIEEDFSDGI
ncbi:PTS sugar transporter subunit IIA [Neobacillus terrae]|uniref:PTS sugar transporter subunit IIA n=1 Tax=Neobacillus terrae TaxID=3034837 RepID=UPI0014085B15|nr:PTS sugar transporter subunit IIA [Neobacillus terrae]NHM33646.1 PTS sugar transporter subunit IIA [Neobacillus terrae]